MCGSMERISWAAGCIWPELHLWTSQCVMSVDGRKYQLVWRSCSNIYLWFWVYSLQGSDFLCCFRLPSWAFATSLIFSFCNFICACFFAFILIGWLLFLVMEETTVLPETWLSSGTEVCLTGVLLYTFAVFALSVM